MNETRKDYIESLWFNFECRYPVLCTLHGDSNTYISEDPYFKDWLELTDEDFWEYNFTLICILLLEAGEDITS